MSFRSSFLKGAVGWVVFFKVVTTLVYTAQKRRFVTSDSCHNSHDSQARVRNAPSDWKVDNTLFSYRANRVQLRRIKATTLTHQLPYDKNVWQIVVPLFWELNLDKQNSIYHFICWRDRRFEKLHTQKKAKKKKYIQFWHNFWENIIALFCSASSKKNYVQF